MAAKETPSNEAASGEAGFYGWADGAASPKRRPSSEPGLGACTIDQAILDRARVGREISNFRRRLAAARLRLYRQHLQVTVTRATPLLDMVVRDQGVDFRGAMHRLQAPYGWPDARRSSRLAVSIAKMLGHRRPNLSDGIDAHDASRTVLVRTRSDPAGQLLFRVVGDCLELTTRIGEISIRTEEGFVLIVLPFHLPDTLEMALIGRAVSFLVGHPWFSDERWVIDSIHRSVRNMTFKVTTGYDSLRMPWNRLLSQERAD